MLLVGWGSTYGPIHEAVKRAREHGEKVAACICVTSSAAERTRKNLREIQALVVVEMNDEGLYGYGQLATILRARYCNPTFASVTKTDGLTFRVREIPRRRFPRQVCLELGAIHRTVRFHGNGEQDVDVAGSGVYSSKELVNYEI